MDQSSSLKYASRRRTTSQREPHYRSGPKSLSINRGSGRIERLMLTGSSNVVHSLHSLTATLDDVVERRAQGPIAALFDVDNTLLPGEASEVRFFRFLWRRGLVGWGELSRSAAWLARHVPPFSLHSLRERKIYLAGKRPADIESYAREFCQVEMIGKAVSARSHEAGRPSTGWSPTDSCDWRA